MGRAGIRLVIMMLDDAILMQAREPHAGAHLGPEHRLQHRQHRRQRPDQGHAAPRAGPPLADHQVGAS